MRKRRGALCALLVIFLLFVPVLLLYAFPIGTQSVDWSLMAEDGQAWQGEMGWTVYVIRDGKRILLDADGTGGYDGCQPGETFYYSRVWDADIAQPVLRVDALLSSIAVWVDDKLQYSDVPLDGASFGAVTLPMLRRERGGAAEIPLEDDLNGQILTIAQASAASGEKQGSRQTVYPCSVKVTAAYGYERGIISKAYGVGLLAACLWLITLLLTALAIWNRDTQLALLALLAFTRLLAALLAAPFLPQYFQHIRIDGASLANQFAFTLMLAFLAVQHKSWKTGYWALLGMSALHGLSVALSLLTQIFNWQSDRMDVLFYLSDWLATVFLLLSIALCMRQARRRDRFFQIFLKLFGIGAAVCVCALATNLLLNPGKWQRLLAGRLLVVRYLRQPLLWLTQGALLVTVLISAYQKAAAARERRVYDALFAKAAVQSYESLKRHQEEVMMLRHETTRHYTALKGFLSGGQDQRAMDYLDELLRQQKSVSQVVNSANELMNILLNSRVALAEEAGIAVEIVHMNVPEKLPLNDTELASLVLNILDNAIEAATKVPHGEKRLRIDMHCKSDYFVFSCENTASPSTDPPPEDGLNHHGYGQQLIRKIMAEHGNLITVHGDAQWYAVNVALRLHETAGGDIRCGFNDLVRPQTFK